MNIDGSQENLKVWMENIKLLMFEFLLANN